MLSRAHEETTMVGIVPRKFIRKLLVNGKEIETDSEGYILHLDEWSEDYVRALAQQEGLALTDEHWQVIRYLRTFFQEHGVQANVREMIKHFRKVWGPEKGSNQPPAPVAKLFRRRRQSAHGNFVRSGGYAPIAERAFASGTGCYLHKIFPRGGPQKQGNRLAGLLRTKGEH